MISIFDLFSIGIGPSSSHTVGPMRAARDFLLQFNTDLNQVERIEVILYGSLAFTGHGHGTDKAIFLGLLGDQPETVEPDSVKAKMDHIIKTQSIELLGQHKIHFAPSADLIFNMDEVLDYHSNGMRFKAFDAKNKLIKESVYFSIGGGFIVNEAEISEKKAEEQLNQPPYPFDSAKELIALCKKHKMNIGQLMLENEKSLRSEAEIKKGILKIAEVMMDCIKRGCESKEEYLPGKLKVKRRAP